MTWRTALPSLAFTVLFLLFWQYGPEHVGMPEYILPKLSAVARIFLDPATLALYLEHTLVTLKEALLGLVIGCSLGFVVAVLLTESRVMMNTFYPYIIAMQCMPKVAIAPLLLVWFGFGLTSKVMVVILLCFFPMLVNTITGIRSVTRENLELFHAIRASRLKTLIHLLIPAALPSIFTGIELAVVVSLLGAIVGEFIGAEQGLGVLLLQAQFQMNIAGVFAILCVLALLGVVFNITVRTIRRRSLFWIAGEAKK